MNVDIVGLFYLGVKGKDKRQRSVLGYQKPVKELNLDSAVKPQNDKLWICDPY
jgi:hypothetical protein